jgi:hypothetical protein
VVWVIEQYDPTAGEWNEMAAVGLLEDTLIKHELRGAMGNDATSKGDHIVEALRGAGEIVRGCDHGAAASRFRIEDVHDLLLRRWVNARDGLVEQVDLWVCGDRTRQEHPAALTTREFADLALRKVDHINARERISNRSVIGCARSTEWPERRSTTHHYHLANRDGETPVHLLSLRHICHTLRVHANGGSEYLHAATPRLHQPSDALQERGLPATIWPKDRGERPRRKAQ